MEQDRLRKMCELALDTSYSGVSISEFRALPTHKFDEESGKWIPDSYSLFIMLKKQPVNCSDQDYRGVEKFFESLLGFETCVDFV
jgi:hypothetical protein